MHVARKVDVLNYVGQLQAYNAALDYVKAESTSHCK